MKRRPALSGYRIMWLYVMFDLPVGTKSERRAATRFRKDLLDDGFEMAQFSVYIRCVPSKEAGEARIRKIQSITP
ncbi:MAG: CRISPR-associated endonuclease Cas2, partial [Pseudomonadota bacterium]